MGIKKFAHISYKTGETFGNKKNINPPTLKLLRTFPPTLKTI